MVVVVILVVVFMLVVLTVLIVVRLVVVAPLVVVALVLDSDGGLASVSSAVDVFLLACRPRHVALLSQVLGGGCCRQRSHHDADPNEESEEVRRGHPE